jgi:hypothetical protein
MPTWENPSIETLEQLASEAEEALRQAAESGDLSSLDAKLSEFDTAYKAAEKELNPFEKLLNLAAQYEGQKEVLGQIGLGKTETLNGEHYPTLDEIRERLLSKKEVMEKKIEQGFTKLLIVPFGMDLNLLAHHYGEALKIHAAAGKLFAEGDPNTPLELNEDEPVYVWEGYNNNDEPIYFPTTYDPNAHGGMMKPQAMSKFGAWQIYLVEETPIPREGKGKELGKRKQLEANLKPTQYLEKLKEDAYKDEVGSTPELWFMKALTRLEEKNEVIDDIDGKGSLSYNLGAYFPNSANVSCAYWSRGARKASVGGRDVSDQRSDYGAASAVRV